MEQGIIGSEQFSLMLNDGTGHVDFGEPDTSQILDGDIDNVVWFPQESQDTHFWFYSGVNGIQFGEEDTLPNGMTAKYAFNSGATYSAVFNTGVHHTIAPNTMGYELL